MAISPHVISTPNSLQMRRNGKFPTVVRGARYVLFRKSINLLYFFSSSIGPTLGSTFISICGKSSSMAAEAGAFFSSVCSSAFRCPSCSLFSSLPSFCPLVSGALVSISASSPSVSSSFLFLLRFCSSVAALISS